MRMGVELPTPVDREEARERLGLGSGLILASFGLVTPEKQIAPARSWPRVGAGPFGRELS